MWWNIPDHVTWNYSNSTSSSFCLIFIFIYSLGRNYNLIFFLKQKNNSSSLVWLLMQNCPFYWISWKVPLQSFLILTPAIWVKKILRNDFLSFNFFLCLPSSECHENMLKTNFLSELLFNTLNSFYNSKASLDFSKIIVFFTSTWHQEVQNITVLIKMTLTNGKTLLYLMILPTAINNHLWK